MSEQKSIQLIIEGCDCVGKTTLIEELKKRDFFENFAYLHNGAPANIIEATKFMSANIHAIMSDSINTIYDRSYLSERVYGPIMRNWYPSNALSDNMLRANDNVFLVLLHAPANVVQNRFDGKYIFISDIPLILDTYQIEFRNSNISNKMIFDTSKMDTETIANKIINYMEMVL